MTTTPTGAGHPADAPPHPDIVPVRAFNDNYIWMLINTERRLAAVVDPGDAAPVISTLEREGLTLSAVLVTHHHPDHVGGLEALRRHCPALKVHGPYNPRIAGIDQAYRAGEVLTLDEFDTRFEVLEVPGHTLDHIAWYAPRIGRHDLRPVLFCGDTLFAGGCGRLFEGSAAQMHDSLSQLASLPPQTLVYCAHEYTASNLRFAQLVEPGNAELAQRVKDVTRLREAGIATVPSTIGTERATNPFLRCEQASVQHAARERLGHAPANAVETLSAIRSWKDVAR